MHMPQDRGLVVEHELAMSRRRDFECKDSESFHREDLLINKCKKDNPNEQSIKSSNGKSPIVVGTWGGTGGHPWDDGVYSMIRQVVITHGAAIDSIRIEYDLKGRSVWSEKHGSTDGGSETDKVVVQMMMVLISSLELELGKMLAALQLG